MKIAVDAMGGDYAPAVVMEAIQSVLKEIPDVEILLVGHKEKLSYYMEKMNLAPSDRLEVVHAETVVEMSDPCKEKFVHHSLRHSGGGGQSGCRGFRRAYRRGSGGVQNQNAHGGRR